MKFSRAVQDLKSEKAWPALGKPGKAKQRPPSVWDHIPDSVVAPLTVMTKGKAAPKSSAKVTPKWSPKFNQGPISTPTAAAADLDPLPEPQQPAQEAVPGQEHKDAKEESDAGHSTSQKSDEKMEDKHEKEDKHEEKTEPNGSNASNASTTSQDLEPIPQQQESSSEHGEGRGDVESASSAAEPTPAPEIAQAKEAPQALCLRVGMYQWPTKDQTPMPNVHLRVGSSEDLTTTQLLQVFGSSSRSIVKYFECILHK